MKRIFSSLLFVFTVSSSFSAMAACLNENSEVTLTGIVTNKATFVSPDDFGWAPANGFVPYEVLVTSTPVCYQDADTFIEKVYVLQIFGVPMPSGEVLQDGVSVTVKGQVFPAHTGHHFEKLLLNASSIEYKK